MRRLILLSVSLIFSIAAIHAQSKKELRAEVAELKNEIAEKDRALAEARQNEKISQANAAEFEAQAKELQDANATLLTNIKTLTEATAQRSDNISRTLETIKRKEEQLNVVNAGISAYDSIAFIVLSNFKKTLGENALVGVQKDALTVELSEVGLFGSGSGSTLLAEGSDFLNKIANAAKQHNGIHITLVSAIDENSGAEQVKKRSKAIIDGLHSAVSPDLIKVALKYKSGAIKSYQIRVHPDWQSFYLKVRETVKNSG